MSVTADVLKTLRDVIVMNEKVTQLSGVTARLQARQDDHNNRIVRLETIIELAAGRGPAAGTRRLPLE